MRPRLSPSTAGVVEKYIGDAVMATFGVAVASDDDAVRAVRAATELRFAARQTEAPLGLLAGTLDLRVGVNTGEVVVSRVGDGWRVTGDVVNTAARLQAAAAPGRGAPRARDGLRRRPRLRAGAGRRGDAARQGARGGRLAAGRAARRRPPWPGRARPARADARPRARPRRPPRPPRPVHGDGGFRRSDVADVSMPCRWEVTNPWPLPGSTSKARRTDQPSFPRRPPGRTRRPPGSPTRRRWRARAGLRWW
ncbi:adenylate/guanylate cyclase domain-containing protein [Georgenia sp. SUBG003]|uniref:adenylate/guanylate cyclase domain-containing protein n=1 Tax=Georgenia sp. SUBG003 TaxID=1497974 RepID=UPI003AB636A4